MQASLRSDIVSKMRLVTPGHKSMSAGVKRGGEQQQERLQNVEFGPGGGQAHSLGVD